MQTDEDIKFMTRSLSLAASAAGLTYPNPLVGSVIVADGRIIGEGYHRKAGGPHAEVAAIDSVTERHLLPRSTIYVNLEPCSHFGRTPPCADRIISEGIRRVVTGTADTSEKVSGEGIARLKAAGCTVVNGVLEGESRWMNRRFFTFHEKKRPYIILKWAESKDGYIDKLREPGYERTPNWITGKAERVLVHRWRAEEQAILAGGTTVRTDNPGLNVRLWKGNDPVRIVLSSSGMLNPGQAMFQNNGTNIVFTHNSKPNHKGVEIIHLNKGEPSALQVCRYLYEKGIQSVIVEGGTETISHFAENGLWDEARVFTGMKVFGKGVRAPATGGVHIGSQEFGYSILNLFVNDFR